jgi:hypothetical protein
MTGIPARQTPSPCDELGIQAPTLVPLSARHEAEALSALAELLSALLSDTGSATDDEAA